jgi:hypothetical protein
MAVTIGDGATAGSRGDIEGKETYAFFAQLNMIANVIWRLCICGWCYRSLADKKSSRLHQFTLSRRNDR